MVLALGFLMMVSLLASAALSILDDYVVGLPGGEMLWRLVTIGVSLAVFTVLFAMIFKYLPDVRIGWRDVWAGAFLTAALFSLGKTAIGLYLSRSTVASVYGAAGSLVLLLLWVYYSSQIVFTGAEFTQVWARAHDRRIRPDAHAVPVTEEQRAQEGIPHAARVDEAARERDGRPHEPRRPSTAS
jgi:membrane protein